MPQVGKELCSYGILHEHGSCSIPREGSSGSLIPFAVLLARECNAQLPAKVQLVPTTGALFPTDMAEVVGIIPVVMRQTKGFAQGLPLLLRGATAWRFLWLRESP